MKKLFSILLFSAFLVASAAGQAVGLNPGKMQIDGLEPGEEVDFSIYLSVSGTSENITVKPFVKPPATGSIFDQDPGFINPSKYSEEDVSSWVEWSQDAYEVNPSTSRTVTIGGGTRVVAEGEMEGTLRIPPDAEPGYHAFQVGVKPQVETGQGFGAMIMGLSRTRVEMFVEGQDPAIRQVEVSDVSARRTGEEKVQLIMTLRNTGTVTAYATNGTVKMSSSDGGGVVDFSGAKVAPGETVRIDTLWTEEKMEGGSYSVEGKIGYRTGISQFRDRITVTQAFQEPLQIQNPQEQQEPEQRASPPLLLILLVSVALGSFLYVVGIDIFWVIAASGLSAITIFIITTGTSIFVLLVALMGAGTLVYYQW